MLFLLAHTQLRPQLLVTEEETWVHRASESKATLWLQANVM